MLSPELTTSLERWSAVALEKGWAGMWVEGAILPREMVFFLARCEELGIERIVESGRQDGYSTLILGEFIARRPDVEVYSIDFEQDVERAQRCRDRLKPSPALHLLNGNANVLFPSTLRVNPGKKTALLVDGPKGFWALSLMFSALQYNGVSILSLHNLARGSGYREYAEQLSAGSLFHEDFGFDSPSWRKLGQEETVRLDKVVPGRSAETSTLGLIEVNAKIRRHASCAIDKRFKLFQPPLVRLGWALGLDAATDALFWLSFNLPGLR